MTAIWTAPRTWVAAEVPTKAMMDAHIRDNEEYLKAHVDGLEGGLIETLDSQVSVAGVANVGTTDTTLLSYEVPADMLSEDFMAIRVTATGQTAANANNKKIELEWGPLAGPTVEQPLDTGLNITWGSSFAVRAWITRVGIGIQYGTAYALYGAAAPAAQRQSVDICWAYQDETAPILVHLCGQSTAGANQVWGHTFLVELLRAPA